MKRQIIAMGGGGFSMEPDNPLLDDYILSQAEHENPVIGFLPTASGDSLDYITKFHRAFRGRSCRSRHISLFAQSLTMAQDLLECDIIYVGGGNTRNALAIWRAAGVDVLLREAWEKGALLCGLSAGAICWFEYGLTDSEGSMSPLPCLGFLPGSCAPHYGGEEDRRPAYRDLIAKGELPAGYGLDDSVAVHVVEGEEPKVVRSRPEAKGYWVVCEGGEVIERELDSEFLGETSPA